MRKLHEIASEIENSWKNVNYAARPYLSAMHEVSNLSDKYFYDDARSVVLYFLANAATWRGDDAKRIKAELKAMLK